MSVKPSRLIRSSSISEMSVFAGPIEPLNFHWEKPKPKTKSLRNSEKSSNSDSASRSDRKSRNTSNPAAVAKPDRTPKRIFTVGSPVRDAEMGTRGGESDCRFGGFLEACYSCKKPISLNGNVYMYRHLLAFCSTYCREKQIALDTEKEKSSGNPTDDFDLAVIIKKFYKVKRQCDEEVKGHAVS